MDFKLVGKKNMGLVTMLILVIMLSQSRFLDFLIDTHLGRVVLLTMVILIAYTNKILGLVSVLAIIIAFNNNQSNMVYAYNFYEGFEASGNVVDSSSNIATIKDKVEERKAQMVELIAEKETNAATTETFKGGREGFCMSDRESNILRGKQSNTLPVFNNLREQSDDISPSDKLVFTSDYAAF
jgi:ABC-type multidrug transport system fused ATPase/permease subunit